MAYKAKKKSSVGTKILIWFMFFAMIGGFIATLLSYLLSNK